MGLQDRVEVRVVDITRALDAALLAKTGGRTALPMMQADVGVVLYESLVILRHLEMRWPEPPMAQRGALRHAQENLLVSHEREFGNAGYAFVMNQDRARREPMCDALPTQYASLNALLEQINPHGLWLVDDFGWAEVVLTPLLMRFWFVEYYGGLELPQGKAFERVRR